MPLYIFQNPETGETRDVFFKMNDEKHFQDQDGLDWVRIFTSPRVSIDSDIDPYSEQAFVDKTARGGTVGDIMDMSKEMSEKRGGAKNDAVKHDYVKAWKAKRGTNVGPQE
jgi:hypothetical protein